MSVIMSDNRIGDKSVIIAQTGTHKHKKSIIGEII